MQETTLISAYQADGSADFLNVHNWLDAFYSEASLKKFDEESFNHIISLKNLEKKIGYKFKNKNFLIQSLMQSTFCYEMKESVFSSNERMEFLGDSLLNFIVAENLYQLYPEMPEGELSKFRGALVNEEMLSNLARTIDLGENIFLGKGEFKSAGSEKDSILADALESLIAGIYLDSNNSIDTLKAIFSNMIAAYDQTSAEKGAQSFFAATHLDYFDSKSRLQELTVAKYNLLPTYKSIELNSAAGFRVEVYLGEKLLAQMSGVSKKKIEKQLARKILEEKLV